MMKSNPLPADVHVYQTTERNPMTGLLERVYKIKGCPTLAFQTMAELRAFLAEVS